MRSTASLSTVPHVDGKKSESVKTNVKKTPIRKASLAKTKVDRRGHDQSQEEKPQYQWRRPKDRHGKRAEAAIEHGYLSGRV
jgi:hypothetical protein